MRTFTFFNAAASFNFSACALLYTEKIHLAPSREPFVSPSVISSAVAVPSKRTCIPFVIFSSISVLNSLILPTAAISTILSSASIFTNPLRPCPYASALTTAHTKVLLLICFLTASRLCLTAPRLISAHVLFSVI